MSLQLQVEERFPATGHGAARQLLEKVVDAHDQEGADAGEWQERKTGERGGVVLSRLNLRSAA